MANVSIEGTEVFSVGMVTDLTSNDALHFKENKSIGFDDAIEMHLFLNTFNSDFVRLFRPVLA